MNSLPGEKTKNKPEGELRLSRRIDAIFCLIVLPLVIGIFPVERWAHNFPLYTYGVGCWLYVLYFLNRCLLVPRLVKSHGHDVFSWVGIVLSIGITIALASVELFHTDYSRLDAGIFHFLPRLKMYQQAVLTLFAVVETFSFAIGMMYQADLEKLEKERLEHERDKAVIASLRNNIKPHFMFNTLNSLYGLFLTENKSALPALSKYIEMLQYIHRYDKIDNVSIGDVAHHIGNYIDLQSLRLNSHTKVVYKTYVENDDLYVPPLLLITFIENCFHHGVSSIEDSVIKISLTEKDREITLQTSNRIFEGSHSGNHSGIKNCLRRLELKYPGRYNLKAGKEGDYYKVKLTIQC